MPCYLRKVQIFFFLFLLYECVNMWECNAENKMRDTLKETYRVVGNSENVSLRCGH